LLFNNVGVSEEKSFEVRLYLLQILLEYLHGRDMQDINMNGICGRYKKCKRGICVNEKNTIRV